MATSASTTVRTAETSTYTPTARATAAYAAHVAHIERKQSADDAPEPVFPEGEFWWLFCWDVADQARRTSATETQAWCAEATRDFPQLTAAIPPPPNAEEPE